MSEPSPHPVPPGNPIPSPTIRAANAGDAPAIADIYNRHIDLGGSTFDRVHWTVEAVDALLRCPAPDGWYVAEANSGLLGWASARRFSDRYGFRHACETAIYLAEHAVGTGVADRLQSRIERHCREHQIRHAVAKIIADNRRSLRFHERHGYERVGVQRQIGRLDDRWIDLVILQRIFDEVSGD